MGARRAGGSRNTTSPANLAWGDPHFNSESDPSLADHPSSTDAWEATLQGPARPLGVTRKKKGDRCVQLLDSKFVSRSLADVLDLTNEATQVTHCHDGVQGFKRCAAGSLVGCVSTPPRSHARPCPSRGRLREATLGGS